MSETSISYGVDYSTTPNPALPKNTFSFSVTTPPNNSALFICKLYDANNALLAEMHTINGTTTSSPLPITPLPGDFLTAHLNYDGSGINDFVIKLEPVEHSLSALNQNNISFQWIEFPQSEVVLNKREVTATTNPSSYYTSFEQTGLYYFLAYIPWIKRHFIVESPAEQSQTHTHTGKYSCLFSEGLFGQTYLDTNDIPIPDSAYSVALSFWVYGPTPSPNLMTLTLYLDGNEVKKSNLSLTNPDANGWCNLTVNLDLLTGAKNFSFLLELNSTGHLGPVMWLDDLSINFVTETTQLINYGVSLGGGYIAVANNAAYDFGTGDFTCEAWVKPTSPGPVFGRKSTAGGSNANAGFLFQVNPNGVITLVTDNGFGYYLKNSNPTSAFDGRWHHIAGVRNNGNMSIFFDGKEIPGTVAASLPTPLNVSNDLQLLIGSVQQEQQIYRYYQGMLAEVRLWNIARSANAIADNMDLCLSGTENGLIGYWDFLNQNADDRSRTRNHGIVQGILRFEGDQNLVEITIGKYQAGGAPGAAWLGDHTFAAALKLDSPDIYPRNVDVFFDAGGGHEPSQPNDELDLNVVTVRGRVNDLILMCTGYPVSPQHPKKPVYGHDMVQSELCGLDLTGLRQRTGMCHQVVNRLLYAATWPNRSITLSNYRPGLAPRGYWLSWALFGVYGDLIVDQFNQGKHFRDWCLQIGFPPPPSEVQLMHASLGFLNQDKRQRVIDHIHAVRAAHIGDSDQAVQAAKEQLQKRLGEELVPDELRLMALD